MMRWATRTIRSDTPGSYTSASVQRAVATQGFEMLTIGENSAFIR